MATRSGQMRPVPFAPSHAPPRDFNSGKDKDCRAEEELNPKP